MTEKQSLATLNNTNESLSFKPYQSMEESEAPGISMETENVNNSQDTHAFAANHQNNLKISIDQAVDKIGHGKFQQQILFAAGTCFMADSMEIMLLSFLTLVLQKEWGWEGDHPIEIPIITASMFAGALAGTVVLGPLGDRVGRRPVMSIAAFVISFFGLVTSFCNTFPTMVFVRFMVGFGIGGLTVPFDILAEFLPTENRGKYLLLIEYFWTIGSMSVPIIAFLTFELIYSWRLFVALCAIPCLLSTFATMKCVPESPRWLIMKGRNQEALQILMHAATVNGFDAQLIFPEGCVIECDEVESSDFKDLFKVCFQLFVFENLLYIVFKQWNPYLTEYFISSITYK